MRSAASATILEHMFESSIAVAASLEVSALSDPFEDPAWVAAAWESAQDHEADPDDPAWLAYEDRALAAMAQDEDPLAEVARHARVVSSFQGSQLRTIAAFVREQMATAAANPGPIFPAEQAAESAAHSACAEVGLALGLAASTASEWVDLAMGLSSRLPATLAALENGKISLPCARVLLQETENLSATDAARVEAQVLPKSTGRTPGSLRDLTRRRVLRLDPDAAWKRRVKAREQRDVSVSPERDGMAHLGAYLAAEDAIAVFGVIDTYAHAAAMPGDERQIGARRADALVDLILRPGTQAARSTVVVTVHADTDSAQGTSDEPGHLDRYGPIPAQLVRKIAEQATSATTRDSHAGLDGADLDAGADRYEPSTRLARAIRARDKHCRFPGCRMPAWRCDLDHTISFKVGGRTVRINLAALCRRHHRIKHLPGWACTQGPGGVLTWTTPHGKRYVTRPPRPVGDDPPDLEASPPGAPTPPDDAPPF